MKNKPLSHLFLILVMGTLINTPQTLAGGRMSRLLSLTSLSEELFQEVCNGNAERVTEIIARDSSLVKAHDVFLYVTPLIKAAYRGNIAIVEILITAGSSINTKTSDGETALMAAAWNGHAEIIDRLLTANAQVNAQSYHRETALIWAARRSHADVVRTLLDARADITVKNQRGKTALDYAQERGCANIVELLENHVPKEKEEETIMVKPAV